MIPSMLDVIFESTHMGVIIVARVTQDRWLACAIRDEINFGLKAGQEVPIRTTICGDIQVDGQPVIIEHADQDPTYCNHPTPQLYGFQSYISVPIFLRDGAFFGTLCAIDPQPRPLRSGKALDMFLLFADLIAFHLQNTDVAVHDSPAYKGISNRLANSEDENRQYLHISNHNLQEPLRKIAIFSSLLAESAEQAEYEKTKNLAVRINANAQKFSVMIKDLSAFAVLNEKLVSEEQFRLARILDDVLDRLKLLIQEKQANVEIGPLPELYGSASQFETLFFNLIINSLTYSAKDRNPEIRVYSNELDAEELPAALAGMMDGDAYEIVVEDNGIGIDGSQLERIFDIFSLVPVDEVPLSGGLGLAFARKIVRNHNGIITAESTRGVGTKIIITLPKPFTV